MGLIQAVWLAKLGHAITAIDVSEDKIMKLQQWIAPIYEDGLEELLQEYGKNIIFTTEIQKVKWTDVLFLCVGTPQDEDGKTDLWYLMQACKDMKPYLTWSEIVIIKSTVPIGTNQKVYTMLWEKNPVISNPEFLREGRAIEDFFNPDRIVLWLREQEEQGVVDVVKKMYHYFQDKKIDTIMTNWQTAELIKYTANSFLATKISFINEIARLADKVWADVQDIATAIGMDKRIWKHFLQAGIGYGWSCFPKDVTSLIHQFKEHDLAWSIVQKVDEINSQQAEYFTKKIDTYYKNGIHGKTIAVVWVAFKPDTDDLRESRWLEIIQKLLYRWAKLKIFDYNKKALENFDTFSHSLILSSSRWFFPITICASFDEVIQDSDTLVITVEDKRILEENLWLLQKKLADKIIFDGKNILSKKDVKASWCAYIGVWC